MPYIRKIIEMKAGPKDGEITCTKCRTGRAVWCCLDCCNKRPICVLCCRNGHKQEVFHRVEKWNGRFFQKGALWQVGVKIYLGHGGKPCPKSGSALTGLQEYIHMQPNHSDVLAQVATEMGISLTDVLKNVSDALDIRTDQ